MNTGMYGVILWSDPEGGQAVIWCEDRGDLAYYKAPERPDHGRYGFFDAGDYVEFEVIEENSLRRVRNPSTVKSTQHPHVRQTLRHGDPTFATPPRASTAAQVIDISDRLAAQAGRARAVNRRG